MSQICQLHGNKTKVENKYDGNKTMIVPAADAALAVAYSPTQNRIICFSLEVSLNCSKSK